MVTNIGFDITDNGYFVLSPKRQNLGGLSQECILCACVAQAIGVIIIMALKRINEEFADLQELDCP